MDLDVELGGLPELEARLAHAHAGVLDLTQHLEDQLVHTAPRQAVLTSPRMRARSWGAEGLWQLPAGGWVSGPGGGVYLPENVEELLTSSVQQLLDGH